jgi:broad specificity phosphatase PhoE
MEKTQIYLIRHGQSQGNFANTFLGHTDLDLTDLGYLQAERCAEYLKEIPVHRIYSSDLQRAYHTALPSARLRGLEIEKCPELREICAGVWENQTFTDIIARYPEEYDRWVNDTGTSRPTGGESVKDMARRFSSCVERIARENLGKTVFIFAHATPIRVLRSLWTGHSVEEVRDVPWPGNASVTHGEYCDGKFTLVEYAVSDFLASLSCKLPDEA